MQTARTRHDAGDAGNDAGDPTAAAVRPERAGAQPGTGASGRQMRGAVNHRAGAAAEDIVAADYRRRGFALRERRWRGAGGEIDLIFERAGALVFVEVKKARDFAAAARRITRRQIERIHASAGGYLARMPRGMDTESRFDAALVDAAGSVEIVENAFDL